METREKEGKRFHNCLECDNIRHVEGRDFECISPRTGYHRYDILRKDENDLIQFPEWCPLLRVEE